MCVILTYYITVKIYEELAILIQSSWDVISVMHQYFLGYCINMCDISMRN